MQDFATVSESDLEIIHALQLAPRASWERLSSVLGADPVTLRRHWQRLTDEGLARITAHSSVPLSNDNVITRVQISCPLMDATQIAETVALDANVFTVHLSSGSHPVVLMVAARNLEHLATYLTERLGHIPGVASIRSHILTSLLMDSSSWNLRVLSNRARAELIAERPQASTRTAFFPTELDAQISEILVMDGRASYADIARKLGVSPSTARRRTEELLATRSITLRCDIARHLLGWTVTAYVHARFQSSPEPYLVRLRREVPEIRLLTTSASTDALHFHLWLRNITDLPVVERKLLSILPEMVIGGRSIMLRTVKQAGHILDTSGRSMKIIPTAM
jgi:DNA-binding Lrp family transcriptional regulator